MRSIELLHGGAANMEMHWVSRSRGIAEFRRLLTEAGYTILTPADKERLLELAKTDDDQHYVGGLREAVHQIIGEGRR